MFMSEILQALAKDEITLEAAVQAIEERLAESNVDVICDVFFEGFAEDDTAQVQALGRLLLFSRPATADDVSSEVFGEYVMADETGASLCPFFAILSNEDWKEHWVHCAEALRAMLKEDDGRRTLVQDLLRLRANAESGLHVPEDQLVAEFDLDITDPDEDEKQGEEEAEAPTEV